VIAYYDCAGQLYTCVCVADDGMYTSDIPNSTPSDVYEDINGIVTMYL